ncbi:MAG: hypothetical protein P4M15_09610 [Alphaproteobacteria bacterium]|nr:hypothetical protein [Alphaproteobacteria bacterium]
MKRNMLEIYAMIACLMLGLYGLLIVSGIVTDVSFLANPAWEMTSDDDKQYVSNEAYCQQNYNACDDVDNSRTNIECSGKDDCDQKMQQQKAAAEKEHEAKYSPEAITKKRLDAYDFEKNIKHERTVMALVHNIVEILIVSGLFFIHWRIGRKARAASVTGQSNA